MSLLFVGEPMVSQRASQHCEISRPSQQAVEARGDNYCLQASEEHVSRSQSSIVLPSVVVVVVAFHFVFVWRLMGA